ncbi:hypothetical protein INR49_008784 [Caranx melampygus]|nr:hypothetical protein INR49_008784 [Caranx melampygus]
MSTTCCLTGRFVVFIMSLSSSDITELMELWVELNLTGADHNLSHVEAVVCSGGVSHAAFLHALSVLYVFIFLVGVVSNGLVVWVNLRSDGDHHETHLYVLHLAVADLSVMATLPIWTASLLQGGRWQFGDTICKLTHLIFSVNLFSSIFFLTCMSVDRYLSVTWLADAPGGSRKRLLRRLVCVLVWLLALAASVPDTYFLKAVRSLHYDGAVCRPVYPSADPRGWMVSIQLCFIILGFAVPFPVITIFYLLLAAAIGPGSDQGRRLILTYIVVFVLCWSPLHAVLVLDTMSLLGVLPFSCHTENFLDVALHLTQCLSLLHCCVNPALYTLLHREHRPHLMKTFILRYSTSTGLSRLINASDASDTEHSAPTVDDSGQV